jgi:5-methylcytosine-specific restriction endonuclease McrA
VKAVSDRRRRRDAVYPARRLQVFERGGGMCEHCLTAQMTETHHKGGRLGPNPHRLDNLVGLCGDCHRRAHSEPAWARQVGLITSRTARMG